jgi:hypothetical protein
MTKNLQLDLLRKYIRASSYFGRFHGPSLPQYLDSIVDTRPRLYHPYTTQHAGALQQPCYCGLSQGHWGTTRTSRRTQIAGHASTQLRSWLVINKVRFESFYLPSTIDFNPEVIIFTTMTEDLDLY